MRQFSEFEKEVLSEIVSKVPFREVNGEIYVSNSLAKIMYERLNVIHISQIGEDQIEIVCVDKERDDEVSRLFDFVFFIRFLEDNYLLGLSAIKHGTEFTSHRYSRDNPQKSWTKRHDNNKNWHINVQTLTTTHATILGKEILRYIHSCYYPSQQLKHLVANGFKSDEQIYVEKQLHEAEKQLHEAKKQTIFAFWTMLVAILTFVATIIIPLVFK